MYSLEAAGQKGRPALVSEQGSALFGPFSSPPSSREEENHVLGPVFLRQQVLSREKERREGEEKEREERRGATGAGFAPPFPIPVSCIPIPIP